TFGPDQARPLLERGLPQGLQEGRPRLRPSLPSSAPHLRERHVRPGPDEGAPAQHGASADVDHLRPVRTFLRGPRSPDRRHYGLLRQPRERRRGRVDRRGEQVDHAGPKCLTAGGWSRKAAGLAGSVLPINRTAPAAANTTSAVRDTRTHRSRREAVVPAVMSRTVDLSRPGTGLAGGRAA